MVVSRAIASPVVAACFVQSIIGLLSCGCPLAALGICAIR
jgi:hypothetical protein